jgi:hypothetical protein
MIDREHDLPITKQAAVLRISRAFFGVCAGRQLAHRRDLEADEQCYKVCCNR